MTNGLTSGSFFCGLLKNVAPGDIQVWWIKAHQDQGKDKVLATFNGYVDQVAKSVEAAKGPLYRALFEEVTFCQEVFALLADCHVRVADLFVEAPLPTVSLPETGAFAILGRRTLRPVLTDGAQVHEVFRGRLRRLAWWVAMVPARHWGFPSDLPCFDVAVHLWDREPAPVLVRRSVVVGWRLGCQLSCCSLGALLVSVLGAFLVRGWVGPWPFWDRGSLWDVRRASFVFWCEGVGSCAAVFACGGRPFGSCCTIGDFVVNSFAILLVISL